MGRWCLDHHAQYGRVPDRHIEDLYMEELRAERLKTAEAQIIETILQRISDDYGRGDDFDASFLYDRTVDYFNFRHYELHSQSVRGLLERGQLDEAAALMRDFRPPRLTRHFRRADEIEPKRVLWSWAGVIAHGEVTLLVGPPFVGKSQVAMSIAAITSSAGFWPTSNTQTRPRDVLIMSAEDAADTVLVPRLIAAGADLTKCHILERADDIVQAVEWFEQALDGVLRQGRYALISWIRPPPSCPGRIPTTWCTCERRFDRSSRWRGGEVLRCSSSITPIKALKVAPSTRCPGRSAGRRSPGLSI
jgi:hypothetical protein